MTFGIIWFLSHKSVLTIEKEKSDIAGLSEAYLFELHEDNCTEELESGSGVDPQARLILLEVPVLLDRVIRNVQSRCVNHAY